MGGIDPKMVYEALKQVRAAGFLGSVFCVLWGAGAEGRAAPLCPLAFCVLCSGFWVLGCRGCEGAAWALCGGLLVGPCGRFVGPCGALKQAGPYGRFPPPPG